MAWDIITHGGGEYLVQVFNANAMFFNGGAVSIMATLIGFTAGIAWINALWQIVTQKNIMYPAKWIAFYILFLSAATQTPCTVVIRDRVTRLVSSVDNVPALLAIPASISSQVGDYLAKEFDKLFASYFGGNDPGKQKVMEYRSMGVAMSSKLIANASFLPVANPEMASNLREYIGECVIYDLAFGKKYDLDTLLNSKDMWKLVTEKASPHGGVLIRTHSNTQVNPPEILSCRAAAEKINNRWAATEKITEYYFGRKMNPNARNPSAWLRQNLVSAYNYMTDQAVNANHILRQNIMRGALIDGFQAASVRSGGNAGGVSNLVSARAKSARDAAYAVQGGMAEQAVSVMKIVIEVLLYSIFPIVCILAALPNNFQVFKTYLVSMLWLQSWAPLYSILNMVFAYRAKNLSLAAIDQLVSSDSGITASTISGLGRVHIDTANYAGFWMMLIPVMSWSLFKLGGGALSGMAHTIMGPTIATGNEEGGNQARGTYTQDQVNVGSRSHNTETRHKFDDSATFTSGQSRTQMADGSMLVDNPGNQISIGGAGHTKSISASSFKMGSHLAQTFSAASQRENGLALDDQVSASNALQAATGQTSNYLDQLSQRERNGEDWSAGLSASDAKSLNDSLDFAKSVREHFGVDDSTATEITAGVSATAATPMKSITGTGLGANVGKTYTGKSGKTVSLQDAMEFANRSGYSTSLKDISESANRLSYGQDNSADRQLSDSISSSLQEHTDHRTSQTQHENNAARFTKAATFAKTHNADIQTDCTQAATHWIAEHASPDGYGNIGINDARKIMDATEGSLYGQKTALLGKFEQEKTGDLLRAVETANLENFGELKQMTSSVFSGKEREAVTEAHRKSNATVQNSAEQNGIGPDFLVNDSARTKAEGTLQSTNQRIGDRESKLNGIQQERKKLAAKKLDEGTLANSFANFFSPVVSGNFLGKFGSDGKISKHIDKLNSNEEEKK